MLYFYRIDVSEGIDFNKKSASKDCDICHSWYFLDKGFKLQPYVCNECHDVLMMSLNLDGIVILNIHCVDFCCNINGIDKSESINFLISINTDLIEKRGIL